jgi:hypothetical protein
MPGNSRHFEKPMAQEFIHIMKTKSVRSLGRLSEWPELRRCLRWIQSIPMKFRQTEIANILRPQILPRSDRPDSFERVGAMASSFATIRFSL